MRTAAAPGSDPTPQTGERAADDDVRAPGEDDANDARLRADKPPHWG